MVGFVLCAAGWLVARRLIGCRSFSLVPALLDVAVPMACFAFLVLGTGKPIFSGILVCTMTCAYGVADWMKRRTLFEPIVSADLLTAADIFRNPSVCLIFPETKWVVLGIAAVIALFAGLFSFEPRSLMLESGFAALVPAAVFGIGWLIAHPLLVPTANALRRLQPSGDPIADSAQFGPFATIAMHGILGRAERPARRIAAAAASSPTLPDDVEPTGPVVVVQCESFFDARRLHPAVSRDLVPAFDACRNESVQWGRMAVPSVGANSVRTEFAVLTGLPESAVGFDRYNPYQGFARQPIASLASKMRAAGYKTICLHPFDRRFYGRDQVMGQLGFDRFIGVEGFPGAEKVGLYTSDVEVAKHIAELIRYEGPKIFVFAITMENHGPWQVRAEANSERTAPGLPDLPRRRDLLEFLRSIGNADAMVRIISDALRLRPEPGVLAFYGDHLPSFPSTFAQLGFTDQDTDYLVWRSDGGAARHRDLPAHGLHAAILDALTEHKSDVIDLADVKRRRAAPYNLRTRP